MSPMASMVGRSSMDWDQEITFPQPNSDDTLPLGVVVNDCKYLASGTHQDDRVQFNGLVGSTSATAGGLGRYEAAEGGGVAGGIPIYRLAGGAPGDSYRMGLEGAAAILPVSPIPIGLAPGASLPSASRVWYLKALIRQRLDGGANPANEAGLLVVPSNAAGQNWPTGIVGANNRGGFGFVQDGANNWTYRSFDRTGVGLVRESIALPAHDINLYNQVEWVMVARRPGFQGYVECWFNNTLICTRNWTGALLEPIGGLPVADTMEWRWVPSAQVANQNAFLFFGVMRRGRFLRDGTEIQG